VPTATMQAQEDVLLAIRQYFCCTLTTKHYKDVARQHVGDFTLTPQKSQHQHCTNEAQKAKTGNRSEIKLHLNYVGLVLFCR